MEKHTDDKVSEKASAEGSPTSELLSRTKTQQENDLTTSPRTQIEIEKELHPETTINDGIDYVTGFKLASIVASLAMACFLVLLDTMVIGTAIPLITTQFHSLHDVGWYVSAYQFGSAASQPLTGKVYTHFKLKWSFLAFFGIFELGSLLCAAATSSSMFIVGRAVAGIGSAGIVNGTLTIISSSAPTAKRPALIGMTMGFMQLGIIIGPLVGGALTSYTTWRWCFYINLPLGAVLAIAIALIRIPEQTPKQAALAILPKLHHYLDLIGFLLFAPAVLQLLLALQYGGNQYRWGSSVVIGLFCGSAATIVVWFFWNRYKGEDALLPISLIRRTTVWTGSLYQAFLFTAILGAIFYLPIYFQSVKGVDALLSGVYLLPTILPQLFFAGFTGFLLTKFGYVIPFAILCTILLSIGSGLYSILQPNSSTGVWVGFQIIAGAGSGIGLQLAITAIQASVSGAELSSAMAVLVFTQNLVPAIILILCNVIFSESLKSQLRIQAPNTNAGAIIAAGASGFKKIVSTADLGGVLKAYSDSIDRVFYLVAASAAMCGVMVWGLGWRDVRKGEIVDVGVSDSKDEREAV